MRVTPYTPLEPAKIAIVGEAPGEEEDKQGIPFVGSSGRELSRMLQDAGIVREDCYITNVFLDRPPANDIHKWCVDSRTATQEWRELGNTGKYPYKPLAPAKYLRLQYMHERARLHAELEAIKPNVVIALGNTALWALTDDTGITKHRGTAMRSPHILAKIVPTYHPAAILRAWDLRAICVSDLIKAARESRSPDIHLPVGNVWIKPTLSDVIQFKLLYLDKADFIGVDVETARFEAGQLAHITCIGLSAGTRAICIPLVDRTKPDYSYWNAEEESVIYKLVKDVLHNDAPKVFQNGLYDIQYFRHYHINVKNAICDTMVMHHSLYPELPKDLGFLGSLYTNFPSWKHLRPRGLGGKDGSE